MIVRIQMRRDSTDEWNSVNPILADGELGIEVTTANERKLKLGDGITHWADLNYLIDNPNLATDLLNHINDIDVHGATDTPTADRIVKYNADFGLKSDKIPVDDNDVVRKLELDNVAVDLTDYYNKEEVDEKLDDVDIDLTDYYNKEEVNEKLEDYNISVNGLLTMGPPDYANAESINKMPALASTWTVEKDGYVSITLTCRATSSSSNYYDVKVNNTVVLAGSGIAANTGDGLVCGIIPVMAGDVISFSKQSGVTYISSSCYFVPPAINPPAKLEAQPLLDYSTEEQDTGRKWIDGKPIYQKTYNFTTPAGGSGAWVPVDSNLTIDTLIDYKGSILYSGGGWAPIPSGEPSNHNRIYVFNNTPSIKVESAGYGNRPAHITFWYTK